MTQQLSAKKQSRVSYLDDLRVLAALAVINLHVTAQYWGQNDSASQVWAWYAVFNNASSWCVNMFLMISGVLFLDPDRQVTARRILTRYIPRIVTAFFFWSGIYVLNQWDTAGDARQKLLLLTQGHFHQWYIFLILGLYLITPLLRRITADRKTTEYCLLLCGIFVVVIPEAVLLLQYFQLPLTGFVTEVLENWNSQLASHIPAWGVFYMMLGWYLHKYDIPRKLRTGIWLLALGAYVLRVLATWKVGTIGLPVPYDVGDLFMTVGVFYLGRDVLSRRRTGTVLDRLLSRLSGASFGIYLAHMLVLYGMDALLGHGPLPMHPVLSVPVMDLVVLFGAFAVAFLLGKIPVLKKYVV